MGSCPGLVVSAHLGRYTKSFISAVLGSDYSGSVKELRRLLHPFLRNASLKKSLKNRKNKTTFGQFSGSKSRDAS